MGILKIMLGATLITTVSSPASAQVTNPPPQYGPPQKIQPVALFGCGVGQQCSITCNVSGGQKVLSNLQWAVVYNYPNSTNLWLDTDGANAEYLLGDSFCDFSHINKLWPLH